MVLGEHEAAQLTPLTRPRPSLFDERLRRNAEPVCRRRIIANVNGRLRVNTSRTLLRLPMKGIKSDGINPC
jgi:hypothetical protein